MKEWCYCLHIDGTSHDSPSIIAPDSALEPRNIESLIAEIPSELISNLGRDIVDIDRKKDLHLNLICSEESSEDNSEELEANFCFVDISLIRDLFHQGQHEVRVSVSI